MSLGDQKCCFCGAVGGSGGCLYERPDGQRGYHCFRKECSAKGDLERKTVWTRKRDSFRERKLCWFDECWVGFCGKRPVPGLEFCERHAPQRCWKCGAQATQNCGSAGSLVCGVPECGEHPHTH